MLLQSLKLNVNRFNSKNNVFQEKTKQNKIYKCLPKFPEEKAHVSISMYPLNDA